MTTSGWFMDAIPSEVMTTVLDWFVQPKHAPKDSIRQASQVGLITPDKEMGSSARILEDSYSALMSLLLYKICQHAWDGLPWEDKEAVAGSATVSSSEAFELSSLGFRAYAWQIQFAARTSVRPARPSLPAKALGAVFKPSSGRARTPKAGHQHSQRSFYSSEFCLII